MDTKQLEYILAIEEEKSITKAAERLYITPSALSQQLKNLEAELNAPLFLRSRSGVTLTPEGNLYLSGAKAMLAVKKEAMEKIRALAAVQEQKTVLSIALNRNFFTFFQSDILPEFERAFPYLKLSPVLVTEGSAKDQVLQGRADMGFIIASGITATTLESIPLQEEPLHLAFPRALLEEIGSPLSYEKLIQALGDLDYISAPLASIRNADLHYLRCAGLDPEILCYTTSYAHLRKLLNRQFAYGVIPEGFIQKTDTFAHVPIKPAARYVLEIVLSSTLSMTPEIRELILLFLRIFDRDNGGKGILDALEHG